MLSVRMVTLAIAYFSLSAMAAPVPTRREVPQEHSHEKYLTSVRASISTNNPKNLGDPVFGLLGAAAAAAGLGQTTDTDCLQQETADLAFTNAKAAGDVQGQVDALIFRAIERNSGSVGGVTKACTSVTAVNPEIAAISQHQDPASPDAAAVNKAITLEVAKQIASVGGDPQLALESGTFAPGQLNDPTARGNSCNVLDDAEGCIFSQNLLVADATAEEIDAAVAGVEAPDAEEDAEEEAEEEAPAEDDAEEEAPEAETPPAAEPCPPPTTVTVTAGAAPTAAPPAQAPPAEAPAAGDNLQPFTGALGDVVAPKVTANGNKFDVEGNASFNNLKSAVTRSCDVQNNQCANKSNGAGQAKEFSVGDCNAQQAICLQGAAAL